MLLIDVPPPHPTVAIPIFRLMKASLLLTPVIVYALAFGISFAVAALIKVIDRSLQGARTTKR